MWDEMWGVTKRACKADSLWDVVDTSISLVATSFS